MGIGMVEVVVVVQPKLRMQVRTNLASGAWVISDWN